MGPRLAPGSFFGEMVGRREVAGFVFAESAFGAEERIPTHAHESAFFYLVLAGASTEVYGSKTRRAETATLVFHPAGETHANQWHGSGGRCFHMEIAPPTMARLREHGLPLDTPADYRGGLPPWLALRLARELHRPDSAAALAMEGLALELLVEVGRSPAVVERYPPPWLRQARELLRVRFAEPLGLAAVAAAVGVHPAHLAREFRRQYRCSVGDYARELRVEEACRQLTTSDTPLVEIALAAGFADQSHFTRRFKQHTGLTPAEFRRHFSPRNSQTTR